MKKIMAVILGITLVLSFTAPVMAQSSGTGTASVTNAAPSIDCSTFQLDVYGPPMNPGHKWSSHSSAARGANPYCFTGETFSASVMASDPNGDADLEFGWAFLYVDYDPVWSNTDYLIEYEMGSVPNSGDQFQTRFECTDIPILGGGATPGSGINWHIEVSVVVYDSSGTVMLHSAGNVVDECEHQMVLNPTFGISPPPNVTFSPGAPGTEQPGSPQVVITANTAFNVANPGAGPPAGCVLIDIDMQVSDMTVTPALPGGGNVINGYAMEACVVAQGGNTPTAPGNYVGGGELGWVAPAPGGGLPTTSQAQLTGSLAHGLSVSLDFFIDLPTPLAPATYVGNIYYYVSPV
jgi:hypothetical protein